MPELLKAEPALLSKACHDLQPRYEVYVELSHDLHEFHQVDFTILVVVMHVEAASCFVCADHLKEGCCAKALRVQGDVCSLLSGEKK